MQASKVQQRFGLEVECLESDKLSSRLVRVRHQGKALADMAEVAAKSERFLAGINYLEDELRAVEQDEVRQAVVLRSETPHQEPGQISYYEVLLYQNGLTELHRPNYRAESTDITAGDFVISDRLLERLAKDLVAIDQ